MGFRQGAYARIWSLNDEGNYGSANISVSRKNAETGNYETEFNDGYVHVVGKAFETAKSLGLPTREEFNKDIHKGALVKIMSCDVTNRYVTKDKKVYYNAVVFEFEVPDGNKGGNGKSNNHAQPAQQKHSKNDAKVDEPDDLPF